MALSRVQYVGKDFDSFFDEILQEAETNFAPEANDFTESNLGTMLVDLVAFGLDTLSFYADLQANESFMSTAVLDDSVVKIARQLGYKVAGAVPASVELVLTIPTALSFNAPMEKGFQFKGGGFVWETVQQVVLNAGGTTVTFTVREGLTVEERFVSDGSKNQVFVLGQVPAGMVLAQGTEEVFVDNVGWESVTFLDYRNEKIVELQPRTVPPKVVFGDGTSGQIPPVGSEVRVRYFATSGVRGNAVASGAITLSVRPLVVGGQKIGFTVTNPSKPTGGSPGKDIEEVRRLAPEVFRAQDSAVTSRDIVALSESFSDPSFGSVSKAAAISVRDASLDSQLTSILAALQSSIDANMYTAQIATLNAIASTFAGTERTDMLASLATIEGLVDLIGPNFVTALAYNDDFQEAFNAIRREFGFDVNAQITTINGIAHSVLVNAENVATQYRLGTGTASASDVFAGTLPLTSGQRVVPGSVSVRENGTGSPGSGVQKATDNGGGAISGSGVTGTIDYFTGNITVTETSDVWTLGEFVDIDYRTYSNDEADVLAATSAIQQIIATSKANLETEVIATETLVEELMTLLESMSTQVIDGIDIEVEKIRAILNTLSETFKVDFIDAVEDIENGTVAVNSNLATVKSDMFDYVDAILSGDCTANVVQVAILTVDDGGFFASASQGLVNGLQAYLDARKEATVTISVVSGDEFLVPAVMGVKISVSNVLVIEDVRQAVLTAVDGLLKGRAFGEDLRLSDVYKTVVAVPGVKFAHVSFEGPIANIDSNGDLVVSDAYIVTKGTVTVEVIE